eukprot:GHVO01039718.1.p2 GENE.GHVO01039718.1~~GHVO01039718.1.p2  ORF type:complete len:179 (-),score=23.33 GHVO01039718.1:118-654(-)
MRDCIEWWCLGTNGLQIFQWQVTFWITNIAGSAGIVLAALMFQTFVISTSTETRAFGTIFRVLTHPTLLAFFTIYFGVTAFLVTFVVLVVGLTKPWISCIWASLLFGILEHRLWHLRHANEERNVHGARGMVPRDRGDQGGRTVTPDPLQLVSEAQCFSIWADPRRLATECDGLGAGE